MERNQWKCDYCRLTKEQVMKRDHLTEEEFEIEKVDTNSLTSFCKLNHAIKWINKNMRWMQKNATQVKLLNINL